MVFGQIAGQMEPLTLLGLWKVICINIFDSNVCDQAK